MTEENQTEQEFIPTVERQLFLANNTGFRVLSKEGKDSWKTNYAYYLRQKKANEALRPLIGKMNEDNQFQVYEEGSWVNRNLWDDFSEPVIENGKAVLNTAGKPKKKLLFDHKYDWLVEFDEPVPVEYYDKETKQIEQPEKAKFYIRLSQNMSGKIEEQITDSRNNEHTRYTVEYDPTKSPAEQYKVKYHSQPE